MSEEENYLTSSAVTSSNEDLLFSHRYQNGDTILVYNGSRVVFLVNESEYGGACFLQW